MPQMSERLFFFFSFPCGGRLEIESRRQTMQDSYVFLFWGSVPPHFTAKEKIPNINAERFD
jgi:hypothetical protein